MSESRVLRTIRWLLLLDALLSWELAARLSDKIDFALSSPLEIGKAVVDLAWNGAVIPHVWATGSAAMTGLALGTLVGTLLGLLTWFSRDTASILRPFVLALGAVPILAIAPLMIIWFGIGLKMKIALAALSTVFVAYAQASKGAESVSKKYVDVLRGMNASAYEIFVKAIAPGSLDWVFSAMKVNAGLALLGTFIGEFISSNVGLGHLVLRASNLYDVPRALAASLFIVGLALLFDTVAGLVEKRRTSLISLLWIPRYARHPLRPSSRSA